jgi:hypothetical protein
VSNGVSMPWCECGCGVFTYTRFRKGHAAYRIDLSEPSTREKWFRNNFGSCLYCEINSNHQHMRRYHWVNKSGTYKRDRDDWLRVCKDCYEDIKKGFLIINE